MSVDNEEICTGHKDTSFIGLSFLNGLLYFPTAAAAAWALK